MGEEIVAFCGLVCTECPAYIATQTGDWKLRVKTAKGWSAPDHKIDPDEIICDGCQPKGGRVNLFCRTCKVRLCAMDKELENCSWCGEYACEKLESLWAMINSPEARYKLDGMRESR